MTKLKKVLFGFMGAYLLMALLSAHAENGGPEGSSSKGHFEQHIQEIYSQLNLSDDQKKQLEANKQQHRVKMESIRQGMKSGREAFQQELMRPQLDMPKINALHLQTKSLQSQMADERLSSILAVRSILTTGQFAKFVSLMNKHRQEHD